jgi:hypothetical protein
MLLETKENRDLHDNQMIQFDEASILKTNILNLLQWIRKHKKGLEQEIFIMNIKK